MRYRVDTIGDLGGQAWPPLDPSWVPPGVVVPGVTPAPAPPAPAPAPAPRPLIGPWGAFGIVAALCIGIAVALDVRRGRR